MTNQQPQSNVTFTKEQFEVLMNALQIAGLVYGIMGDMVDEKFKKQSDELDALESHVLEHADEVGMGDIVDDFDGRNVVVEERVTKAIDDLGEYEEYAFWDLLAHKLARRDLARKLGEEAALAMDPADRYMAVGDIADEYFEEFDEHGLERVRVNKE